MFSHQSRQRLSTSATAILVIPLLLATALNGQPLQIQPGDIVVTERETSLMRGTTAVAELSKGNTLTVTEVRDDWIGVTTTVSGNDQSGWVRRDTIALSRNNNGPQDAGDIRVPTEPPMSREAPASQALRTWTDATGTFKTEAVLLQLESGKVRLRRSDGKEITVPLEKLSLPDQEYVRGLEPPASGEQIVEVRLVPHERIQGSLVNYHRPSSVELSQVPPVKLKAEPMYRSNQPLYACLRLGDADDNQVCVVLDEPEEGSPRLYIDRNNDRDLTNDGDGALTAEKPGYLEVFDVTIQVHYQTGTMPYTLNFYRWKERSPKTLAFHRNSAREGELVVENAKYKLALLDENADARFDDLDDVALLADLVGNGELAGITRDQFFLGDMECKVASVSPDGTRLRIRMVPDTSPRIAVRLTPRERIAEITSGFRPRKIQLSEKSPVPLKTEPTYASQKPLYGTMALGNAEDNQVVVVLDEPPDGPRRIHIDRNGDRDLTNDGDGAWSRETDRSLSLDEVTIQVHYRSEVRPYTINLYRSPGQFADRMFYYRNCATEGEVVLDDARYKILVLDENADARFDDLHNNRLLIDVNEDGKIEQYPDASRTCAEVHLGHPFKLGDTTLRPHSMSPDGTLLTLALSKKPLPAESRELSPGEAGPRFAGRCLDGQTIDLDAEKGKWKYVLLHFWCSDDKCLKRFAELVRVTARYKDHGLRVIGVNLDDDRQKALESIRAAGIDYPQFFDGSGQNGPVAAQYHAVEQLPYFRLPKGVLLSTSLNIVDTWCLELPGQLEERLETLLGDGDIAAANAAERAAVARGGEWSQPRRPGDLRTDLDDLEVLGVLEPPSDWTYPNDSIRGVALRWPYVYVIARSGRLAVSTITLDGESPAAVTQVANLAAVERKQIGNAVNMRLSGDTLLCYHWGALDVFSLADPCNPQRVRSVEIPGRPFDPAMALGQGLAFIMESSHLSVFGLSNVSEPKHLGTSQPEGRLRNGCQIGNHLYVATNRDAAGVGTGISIHDVSEPGKPQEVGFFPLAESAFHVLPVGHDHLIVAATDTAQLLRLSTPTQLEAVGQPVKTRGRAAVVFTGGTEHLLLTAGDLFAVEETGLVLRGKFGIDHPSDGFPYLGDTQDDYAAIPSPKQVILFRWHVETQLPEGEPPSRK